MLEDYIVPTITFVCGIIVPILYQKFTWAGKVLAAAKSAIAAAEAIIPDDTENTMLKRVDLVLKQINSIETAAKIANAEETK